MNTAAVLRGTGHVAAPAVLVIGASLSILAFVGTGQNGSVAQGPPTATAAPAPAGKPSQSAPQVPQRPHPSPRPSSAVTAAAGRDVAGDSGSTESNGGPSGGGSGPSGSTARPSPTAQPPASDGSTSGGITLSARLPLVGVDLNVGGGR